MSGGHRIQWSVSGARSGDPLSGNGTGSGSHRNKLERSAKIVRLLVRSHALYQTCMLAALYSGRQKSKQSNKSLLLST